ncbi:MAG: hypothetical protein HYV09_25665 [Deltaproteobacteria bacterium]|nr:hypothetical protein [Deltaproteobacteria bacterium]
MPPDTPPSSSEADDRAETLVRGGATMRDEKLPLLSTPHTKRALVAHLSRLRQLVPDEARGTDRW